MTKDTFREALLITARVTALAGCTPAVAPVAEVAPADFTEGGTLASATKPPEKPPEPACKNDEDCCEKLVKSELDGGGWSLPDDPETVRCCDVLLTSAEKDWKGSASAWLCCAKGTTRVSHQRFCSPWGPPTPPTIVWSRHIEACRSYEWRECRTASRIDA